MADFKRNTSSGHRDRGSNRSFDRGSGRRDSEGSGKRFGGRSNDRSDSGDFNRSRFGGRSNDRVERTTVICDSCKKSCEVPFKPSSNKPIYCSDCFKKDSSSNSRDYNRSESNSNNNENQFKEIHKKLDKILNALEMD